MSTSIQIVNEPVHFRELDFLQNFSKETKEQDNEQRPSVILEALAAYEYSKNISKRQAVQPLTTPPDNAIGEQTHL